MNMSIIARSAVAIVAASGLVALVGYINTGEAALLSFANNTIDLAIFAVIIVALLINAPRFMR